MIAARSRIRRRAVAFRGGVWYNSHRSPQWEIEDPRRNETKRDNESFSAPRKRPTASRSIFYPFAGRGFCKWR